MDSTLKENFAYWRARGRKATDALKLAREDIAKGKRRYGACSPKIEYNACSDVHGFKRCAWIENAADGLRLAGFADEIARELGHPRMIEHTGWYTEDEGMNGETLRGVVYQLPGHNGESRYAYGYSDPNNEGAAFLSFDLETDKLEAARFADQLAERAAEKEREYQEAWQAGNDYAELGAEIKSNRRAIRDLTAERRQARTLAKSGFPAICNALKAEITRLREEIERATEKRGTLLDNYGNTEAFKEHLPKGV